jgi:uncharacterized protein YjbI with pentapeptide repeats
MKQRIATPQLSVDLARGTAALLMPEATLENVRITDADCTALAAAAMSWDEAMFERLLLAGAKLERLRANDVIMADCDLSAADCSESSWIRASLKGGRMTGWDVNKSMLKDVEFRGCKLDLANFRFAKLQRVRFSDCILTEADFMNAELCDVEFQACHLERVQFDHAKLQNVDLRTSQLIGLKGWATMKGALIDDVQLMAVAPYLAQELGLVVRED